MIDTKNEAIEYFDHNPHSEGVVFIMIDINQCEQNSNDGDITEIDCNYDFSVCEVVENENVITREEQITQSIDNNIIAWRNGDITIDDLIETLKSIKGDK